MDHTTDNLAPLTPGETSRLLVRMERSLNEHRSETKEELAGIREHLSTLNGKTATHAVAIAQNTIRLDAIERLASRPPEPAPLPPELSELLATVKGLKVMRGLIVTLWLAGAAIAGLVWWIVQNVRFGP